MTFAKMWEHIQAILTILATVGIVVDLTPGIKLQPVRWIIQQVGNLMNHDLLEKVNKIEKDLQQHKIESWRNNILDFANSCMNHRRHTKEEFDNFFDDYSDYEKYVKDNKLENGRVEMAHEYVSKIYLHCMETNDFLLEKEKEG